MWNVGHHGEQKQSPSRKSTNAPGSGLFTGEADNQQSTCPSSRLFAYDGPVNGALRHGNCILGDAGIPLRCCCCYLGSWVCPDCTIKVTIRNGKPPTPCRNAMWKTGGICVEASRRRTQAAHTVPSWKEGCVLLAPPSRHDKNTTKPVHCDVAALWWKSIRCHVHVVPRQCYHQKAPSGCSRDCLRERIGSLSLHS